MVTKYYIYIYILYLIIIMYLYCFLVKYDVLSITIYYYLSIVDNIYFVYVIVIYCQIICKIKLAKIKRIFVVVWSFGVPLPVIPLYFVFYNVRCTFANG